MTVPPASAPTGILVHPAAKEDAASTAFDDLLPDRWREGGNRRSLVAVDGVSGRLLGHCRGIDNEAHPGSRVLVLEVADDVAGSAVHEALLRAQVAVSVLPLHTKARERDAALLAALRAVGAVTIQLMPPWTRQVGPELREWAGDVHAEPVPAPLQGRETSVVPADTVEPDELLDLEVEHYVAQHAPWSPAAPPEVLRPLLAEGHEPDSEDSWDRRTSLALTVEGVLTAAALLFPQGEDEPPEVSLVSRPYSSESAWWAKRRLLAEVVTRLSDGDRFCADSHLSMREEYELMRGVPGLADPEEGWTAIVAVPVADGPQPNPLDPALIPDAAAWAVLH